MDDSLGEDAGHFLSVDKVHSSFLSIICKELP